MGRFLFVLAGWIGSLIRAFARLTWNAIKGALNSPFAVLDWTSRRYFQPGVPWLAFLLLLLWSAIEATIFTFTLRPTMNELLADLTGAEPHPIMLSALLYIFLFFLVGGSFACVQALNDAIKSKQYGTIISMVLIEFVVAMFEVLFLYRELVDAITPWMAQQGFNLGIGGTLALAFAAWLGVRGMTWFLFGRYGTPALIAVLARETISREGANVDIAPPRQPEFWQRSDHGPEGRGRVVQEGRARDVRAAHPAGTPVTGGRVQLLSRGPARTAAVHLAVPLTG